ncbi:MAG: GGDEF domain-containing protein [Selenomonadaceae bacterium]|nr:GGDEF domain-containing protein [Selenomonadaceae bacterium]
MPDKTFLIHREILRDISVGVIYVSNGNILYVNPAALEILGRKETKLIGKTFAECFFEYSENDDFNQTILEVIYDSSHKYEKMVQYFTGTEIKHLHIRTSSLKINSESMGIIILMDDVTELMKLRGVALDLQKIKEINRQLSTSRDFYKRNAETDNLTGLLNKITFENKVSEYLNETRENMLAFFVIDLDNFKKANDKFGHQFGDLILKKFAENFRDIFKSNGITGRFGGDEFVALLKNVSDRETVIEIARSIVKMARELNYSDITASVGVAIFDGAEKNYAEVFAAADKSVYVVKAQGRNGFSINGTAKQSC